MFDLDISTGFSSEISLLSNNIEIERVIDKGIVQKIRSKVLEKMQVIEASIKETKR